VQRLGLEPGTFRLQTVGSTAAPGPPFLKDQVAKQKKMDKEIQKWELGKFALKCITAEIDSDIIESGSIGGLFCLW